MLAEELSALPGAEPNGELRHIFEADRLPEAPGAAAHVDPAPQLGLAHGVVPGAAHPGRAAEHELDVVQLVEDVEHHVQGQRCPVPPL